MQKAFRKAIANNYGKGHPFVIYARPGSSDVTGIFQNNEGSCEYSTGKRGFVFAPFSSEAPSLFLSTEHSSILTDKFERESLATRHWNISTDSEQQQAHIKLVGKAVEEINSSLLEKVVVSRRQDILLSRFDLFEMIHSLFAQDVHVFRYAWFHPSSGLWVGATPEILLSVSNLNYKTMSLAGTRSAVSAEKTEWTTKEYHEQEVVTKTIADQLHPFSEAMDVSEVHTVRAGNIEHLRTDISGVIKCGYSWNELVNTLHPTPAVCGSPKEQAMHFILTNEGYDREYYTGYLGPTGITGKQTDLYVNLRCMRIREGVASIFTGGGITRDSDPSAEWIETCNKQQAMLKLLQQFL